MIQLLIRYGPALILFLTVLLTAVVIATAMPRLVILLICAIGGALLARWLFGPLR
jgi:hypothetical protein